jgi:hypothetical protein
MNDFIKSCKAMIECDNLEGLQEAFQEALAESPPTFAWELIFQKVYIHACLKKKTCIVDWLLTLFPMLDPIQQIAVRQVFFYGRYLLAH